MVREQFTNSRPKNVSVFLKKMSPKDLEELAKLAEQYLNAHGKKLTTKMPVTRQDVKTSSPGTHKDALSVMAEVIEQWSALAKHQRHRMSRLVMAAGLIALNVGQWDMKLMSAKQHYSALNLDPERGDVVPGGNPTQAQRVACAMQVPRRSDEKEAGLGMETLERKSGEKMKVLNGACMAEIKDNLPV